MKRIFYLLLIALFCGALVGCSKDGDGGNDSNYEELIVGTWELVKEADGGPVKEAEEDFRIVFKSNGTGYNIEDGYRSDEFEWEINGSSLYVTDGYYEDTFKIKKLSKKELVVQIYDEYDDYEFIGYYERVE